MSKVSSNNSAAAESKLSEKQITTKQYVVFIFFMNISAKLFMQPVNVLKQGGRSAILALGVLFLIEAVIFTIFFICTRLNRDTTFFRLIDEGVGKVFSKIVFFAVLVYSFTKCLLLVTMIKNYLATNVFDSMDWVVFEIHLMIVLFSLTINSLRTIARTMEIFWPFLLVAMIVIAVLISTHVDLTRLLPIGAKDGTGETFSTVLKNPLWYGDNLLLMLTMGNVKQTKHFKKAAIMATASSIVLAIAGGMITFASYMDVVIFLDYGKKISSITQISISRINTSRFDIVLFCIWMIGAILHLGTYTFLTARTGEFMLQVKKTRWSAVVVILILYILTVFVFDQEGQIFGLLTKRLNYFGLAVQIFIPILTLVLSILRRKGIYKKSDYLEDINHTEKNRFLNDVHNKLKKGGSADE